MIHKTIVSFSLFCAIFLMVGCAGRLKTIDNVTFDNPSAPLRITEFNIDYYSEWGQDNPQACSRDDSVWVITGSFSRSLVKLVKYRAGTGVQLRSVPLKGGRICALTSNSVWVIGGGGALSGISVTLTQIDIATNRVVNVAALEGLGPVTTDQDTLWILMPRSGKLYRIRENDTNPVFLSQLKETYRSIAFAAGSIWALDLATCRVDRIDPISGKILAEISLTPREERTGLSWLSWHVPRSQCDPSIYGSLAYGEGSIWLSCDRPDPSFVLRIDPNTNEVIANIPVDRMPKSVVFAMGYAWISTYESKKRDYHELEKIDVRTNKVVHKYGLGGMGRPMLVPVTDGLWAIGNGVAWHIKEK